MKSRSTSVIVAALAAMISASPAQAGGLKQVAEISIPGDPITDIGIMAIDQTTGLGYLADKTNKSVVVFHCGLCGRVHPREQEIVELNSKANVRY